MNASSLEELRASQVRTEGDEKMDQVRQLLIGDFVRETNAQILDLNARLTALAARIDALGQQSDTERRAASISASASAASRAADPGL